MPIKRLKIIVIVIFMVTSLIVYPRYTECKDKHPYGGTLVWGSKNLPTIINPVLTTHSISINLMGIIMNRTIRVNSEREIEPDLAERWEISDDGLTYTFYLRKGVRFHDGVEFTAEDIQFTIDEIINSKNNSPHRSRFALIKKIDVVDRHILKIILSNPFPTFLYNLAQVEIAPKHILEGEDLKNASFNYAPVGTGPFKFKSWDKDTNQIEVVANPDYFEGRPYLDKVIAKIYPDSSHLWSAIMRQEIDLITFINGQDSNILKKDPYFRTYKVGMNFYSAILFNLEDPILKDITVRRAIAHAINRGALIDSTFSGGLESVGPFHPSSPGFDPNVKAIEYDPGKAKFELMRRGWSDLNGDGILEKDGMDLEIRMLVDEKSDIYRDLVLLIRQQLSEIGMKIQVQLYHDENDLTNEYLEKNKPQAWLRFFDGYGTDGGDSVKSWYSLSNEFGKLWKYKNEEVDALFEQTRASLKISDCADIYKKMHELIYNDQPACFLFFIVTHHAIADKFNNIDEFLGTFMPMHTLQDWYISEN